MFSVILIHCDWYLINVGLLKEKIRHNANFVVTGWIGSCHGDNGWPDPRPFNHISIEFEIRPKFEALWFKMYSAHHNEILHTSQQCNFRDVRKI